MSDKPLHVRVAVALGYEVAPTAKSLGGWAMRVAESGGVFVEWAPIPHYETDWSATGPLIERLGLGIIEHKSRRDTEQWEASCFNAETENTFAMRGATALIAVCNLILALKESGKLKAA